MARRRLLLGLTAFVATANAFFLSPALPASQRALIPATRTEQGARVRLSAKALIGLDCFEFGMCRGEGG